MKWYLVSGGRMVGDHPTPCDDLEDCLDKAIKIFNCSREQVDMLRLSGQIFLNDGGWLRCEQED